MGFDCTLGVPPHRRDMAMNVEAIIVTLKSKVVMNSLINLISR